MKRARANSIFNWLGNRRSIIIQGHYFTWNCLLKSLTLPIYPSHSPSLYDPLTLLNINTSTIDYFGVKFFQFALWLTTWNQPGFLPNAAMCCFTFPYQISFLKIFSLSKRWQISPPKVRWFITLLQKLCFPAWSCLPTTKHEISRTDPSPSTYHLSFKESQYLYPTQ